MGDVTHQDYQMPSQEGVLQVAVKEVSSRLWLEAPGFFYLWMSWSPVRSWCSQLSFHPWSHQDCHRSCPLGGALGMTIHVSELRRSP